MDAATRTRLIRLLGMLGSAHDGEVLNAAKLAQRTLGAEGITWEELLTSVGNGKGDGVDTSAVYSEGWRSGYARGLAVGREGSGYARQGRAVTWLGFVRKVQQEHYDDLTDWEQGFVDNWVERGWNNPSPKQRDVLIRISNKIGVECPEA